MGEREAGVKLFFHSQHERTHVSRKCMKGTCRAKRRGRPSGRASRNKTGYCFFSGKIGDNREVNQTEKRMFLKLRTLKKSPLVTGKRFINTFLLLF